MTCTRACKNSFFVCYHHSCNAIPSPAGSPAQATAPCNSVNRPCHHACLRDCKTTKTLSASSRRSNQGIAASLIPNRWSTYEAAANLSQGRRSVRAASINRVATCIPFQHRHGSTGWTGRDGRQGPDESTSENRSPDLARSPFIPPLLATTHDTID